MGGRPFDGFLYQRYLTRAEQLLADFNRKMALLGAQESPFCMEGCAHCCNHLFFVSSPEVDIVVRHLLHNETLLTRFLAHAARRKELLSDHATLLEACEDRGESGNCAADAFLRTKIPCAFLDNDRCMIYEVRPMTCASFVSIVPPRICASDPKGSMSAAMNQLLAETRQTLRKLAKTNGVSYSDRLDVSRQVLLRLAEIGRIPVPCKSPDN